MDSQGKPAASSSEQSSGDDLWVDDSGLPTRRELRTACTRGKPSKKPDRIRVRLHPLTAWVLVLAMVLLVALGLFRLTYAAIGTTASSNLSIDAMSPQAPSLDRDNTAERAGDDQSGLSFTSVPESSAAPAPLVVYISGAVHRPVLASVPVGSRVADAVEQAGGLLDSADLARVNLARELEDGEHVHIPAIGEATTGQGSLQGESPVPDQPQASDCVDLNSADEQQLQVLDGVGPKIAARIIKKREETGGFASSQELVAVSGIGQALLTRIRAGLCE